MDVINYAKIKQIDSQLSDIAIKQNWYEVFKSIKVKNDSNLIFKKTDSNNIAVYINHYNNTYQKWNFTRNNGLDNSVTSHANGDAWQVNNVLNVKLGVNEMVDINSVDLIKSGSWTSYPPNITSTTTNNYVETTVKGSDIFIKCLAKSDGGIGQISIDGVNTTTVDLYNVSTGGTNVTYKIASGLTDTDHIVRLTVTGTKNASSSGYAIRFQYFCGVSGDNLLGYLATIGETADAMPSGKNYRYGQSAIEIAINSTYNGNTVWSGTYHKNLYPVVADGQKIYVDGIEKTLSNFTAETFYSAKDIMFVQDLRLLNTGVDIAKVKLVQHFTSEGYHVKWILEWLVNATINTSYSAMFGTSVDKLIFGDSQTIHTAVYDDHDYGYFKTFSFIGWQTQDNYVVSFKALNEPAMAYTNSSYMYFRDRTTDAKVYVPRFTGAVSVGNKWVSEFIVSIAKCNNVSLVMS